MGHPAVFLTIAFVVSIIVGCLTHVYVEKPLLKLSRSKKWSAFVPASIVTRLIPLNMAGMLANIRRGVARGPS